MCHHSSETLITVILSVTCGREASSNGWLRFKVKVCVCVCVRMTCYESCAHGDRLTSAPLSPQAFGYSSCHPCPISSPFPHNLAIIDVLVSDLDLLFSIFLGDGSYKRKSDKCTWLVDGAILYVHTSSGTKSIMVPIV